VNYCSSSLTLLVLAVAASCGSSNGREAPDALFDDDAGPCPGLDEPACIATPLCVAMYWRGAGNNYMGCRGTFDSDPLRGVDCVSLEYNCARSDECALVYRDAVTDYEDYMFDRCGVEQRGEEDFCPIDDPGCRLVCHACPDDVSCRNSCRTDANCAVLCGARRVDDPTCEQRGCYVGVIGTGCVCNVVNICRCESWTFACTPNR
jgi:hypothetical protein